MSLPRGPEAVKAALIEAATDLYAERGDAPVRTIAARAGVNHGLVYHYLGGKQGLRRLALERLAASLHERLPRGRSGEGSLRELGRALLRMSEADPRFVKILARALLDGEVPEQLQASFPVVEALRRSCAGHPEARALLAEGLLVSLGALVFGPWVCAALGLSPAQLEATREAALERIFARLEAQVPL